MLCIFFALSGSSAVVYNLRLTLNLVSIFIVSISILRQFLEAEGTPIWFPMWTWPGIAMLYWDL